MEVSLTGKHILITGGTSALGRAFVEKALQAGAHVYFTFYRNQTVADQLINRGSVGFQVDLSRTGAVTSLKAMVESRTKTLDGLILNAAAVSDHTIQNMTEEEWDYVLNVNLKSVYLTVKSLLRFFLKNERSKILTVISQVGIRGGFGQANYAAAKGGLIAFTKSIAKELGKRKILVNAFNPGFMVSQMTESLSSDIRKRNEERSTLGEISDPHEVADFMVYLMSERMNHVSGQVFHFDSRSL
ncbi:MAG: beta-ketoacyl-ACP reductase [Candidatus Omnitrophica bacterium CG11_big_fil_rev_8_21_14_0_20_45_26]|uniref:Beta-ketoacyl-ACP reductase n=1 Tax=Candidatus Abzuiibacterium crystallinum TaxID=1974748 RepID=A0A2H0LN16_9BACT|nr:MAG: beta-ketoacyl-ACP reductase [Candidatus Omnitrophica bacterium CG11_big_fil_rev_8_21_14_0_20_45_26]PIW64228.1 MAG: beta-ketoacyl-ACP reductase [Candidatus Omnitrophica bacterium CG12_big_fil_rev_8_21_14_0_65_45_16]